MTSRVGNPVAEVAVWIAVAIIVGLFVAGIVAGVVLGAAATPLALTGWTAGTAGPILRSWGLPAGSAVAYLIVLELVMFGLGAVAAWLLLHRPWSRWRVYVALVVLLHVTVGGSAPLFLAEAVPALAWVNALTGLGWFGVFSLLLVFPTGRFVPRWIRWTVPAWILVFVLLLWGDPAGPPIPLLAVALLVLLVTGAVAQGYRYAKLSDPDTRRRTRWVLVALVARIGLVVVIGAGRLLLPAGPPTANTLVLDLVGLGVSYLISSLLVLAIAVAAVRHGLFDADVVISRAVLYVSLTTFVFVLYGVVVGVVGAFWPGGGLVLPVLATAAAAVALVPVRSWLQRRIGLLVYGDRAEPYRLVRELGDRLAATTGPDEAVRTVVERVGPALGLGRMSIMLGAQDLPAATYLGRDPSSPIEHYPIEHQEELVGRIEVAPSRASPLTATDRHLLSTIAGQAGLAVAAARAAAEVRLAREQAVAAREEERRRMHQDLHDGLGPTLASISQRVDVAAQLVESDPTTSRQILAETGRLTRDAVADVRRVVYALRPPRLDDLGLVEAVRASAAELSVPGRIAVDVRCPDPLPPLPAVIETTAYRIALEAMTNAVRHAGAGCCLVTFVADRADHADAHADHAELCVTVTDDGQGLGVAATSGAGMRSMRDRSAAAGGRLEIESPGTGGVVVTARLPLSEPEPT